MTLNIIGLQWWMKGRGPGAPPPPLTLGKKRKESQKEEKLAGQATKKPGSSPPKVWIHHWIIRWYERKFRRHITFMIKIAFEKFLFKLNNVWTLETEVTKKITFCSWRFANENNFCFWYRLVRNFRCLCVLELFFII